MIFLFYRLTLSFGGGGVYNVIVGKLDTVAQFGLVRPAHCRRLRHVQKFSRRAVWFRRVPKNFAFITYNRRNQLRQSFNRNFFAGSRVDGFVAAVIVHEKDTKIRKVVDVKEFAQRASVAPTRHGRQLCNLRVVETFNQRGQHMRARRVIIIVRAVKIAGHDRNKIRAVLPIEIFAVLEPGNFCQRVSLVGLFKRGSQKRVLFNGLRRKFRINARRAREEQFFAIALPRGVNRVHFNQHVVVHCIRRPISVGDNAADLCRCQKNVFGLFRREEFFNVSLPRQVKFGVRPRDDVVVTLPLEFAHNGRADHAAMPRDENFCVLVQN